MNPPLLAAPREKFPTSFCASLLQWGPPGFPHYAQVQRGTTPSASFALRQQQSTHSPILHAKAMLCEHWNGDGCPSSQFCACVPPCRCLLASAQGDLMQCGESSALGNKYQRSALELCFPYSSSFNVNLFHCCSSFQPTVLKPCTFILLFQQRLQQPSQESPLPRGPWKS